MKRREVFSDYRTKRILTARETLTKGLLPKNNNKFKLYRNERKLKGFQDEIPIKNSNQFLSGNITVKIFTTVKKKDETDVDTPHQIYKLDGNEKSVLEVLRSLKDQQLTSKDLVIWWLTKNESEKSTNAQLEYSDYRKLHLV
ncbi:unnamed protein product [Dimorphilus gyrociliatus]|uniref:Uncharacterized protein n=1 Tax=Dimorphilus gyrociliatus TaxID=2664684 RepID=A0A7I8WBP1_9ANNE|nr:unnamed protein product [Dimorphilus gyrociliatus]